MQEEPRNERSDAEDRDAGQRQQQQRGEQARDVEPVLRLEQPEGEARARAGRLQAANDVLERGTELFFEGMIQKVLAKTTREMRPDLADGVLRMMRLMSPEDVAQVQRGMAARPDSVDTLKTINVRTLLITGDEELMTGVNEAAEEKKTLRPAETKPASGASTLPAVTCA